MQDLTKILPSSARQHLLHKPRAHLCGTAEICSTIHKLPRDSASRGSWAQQGLGQSCSLGAPEPSPGCSGHGEWAGSMRESQKQTLLFFLHAMDHRDLI